MSAISFGVLTISDTCYEDASKDKSGPRLQCLLREAFKNANIIAAILPDEILLIRNKLQMLVRQQEPKIAAIITTGGTGFAPRDVTPEATKAVLEKDCPQLAMAIALVSLQKTKFAVLSRGICGISGSTLILNFPGSEKAVAECFEVVRDLLPHALQLIGNNIPLVRRVHEEMQKGDGPAIVPESVVAHPVPHVCPHKTKGDGAGDRNSPYPMISVAAALETIFQTVAVRGTSLSNVKSPIDIPPFRASIKDGYAVMSCCLPGTKKVVGSISAGDPVNQCPLEEDACFKINTGAAVPQFADCIIQVEDTKLLKSTSNGREDLVEILVEPKPNLDIRPIGSDLRKGSKLFPSADRSQVVTKSILASVGLSMSLNKPKIAIISTGNELLEPSHPQVPGKIYDSNSTMLEELLKYFGFEPYCKLMLTDEYEVVKSSLEELFEVVDFVICSGGVSMGDKDFVKPVLLNMGFELNFGRVNMKPGKPMTFASCGKKYFFGLPGNPVSAFVTFHLFVLPALRWSFGCERDKCELSVLQVILQNDSIPLDPRPEYMRASITSKNGTLYASINGNQMSSRLQSIVGADVLVQLPAATNDKPCAVAGDVLHASVLRYDFISKYE